MLRQELVRFQELRDVWWWMQLCVAPIVGRPASPHAGVDSEQKRTATARVFIAAENRLLREALAKC